MTENNSRSTSMEQKKEYLQCKVAVWKKKTKTDKEYLSVSIEIKEDVLKKMLETKNFKLSNNVFIKTKTKDTQPDFATVDIDGQTP